jgi:N-formylglutamate amidohydrolase
MYNFKYLKFMELYNFTEPTANRVPILLSVPHCGTIIPEPLKSQYKPEKTEFIDDTDWFVHDLYNFAPAMGITLLSANISRWVIDLNRHPQSKPLYSDGRVITGLCPTTDFLGSNLYVDDRSEVSAHDVEHRVKNYYEPYHQKIQSTLQDLKAEFGKALLWDCHSIRQFVPSIRPEKFPDLILGDADGTSASPGIIETTLRGLETSGLSVSHNTPFKGGYITREYGRPSENIHALQLEMTKVNYMDDAERSYHPERAIKIQQMLKSVFESLIENFFSSRT